MKTSKSDDGPSEVVDEADDDDADDDDDNDGDADDVDVSVDGANDDSEFLDNAAIDNGSMAVDGSHRAFAISVPN